MSTVADVQSAVDTVAKTSDPKVIASELAGQIQPLLASLDKSDLETKHGIGCILNARLKPDGQKRLTYGGQVMEKLAAQLSIARSTLTRACQFARQYPNLADFTVQYPDAKTWSQVRKVLGQRKAPSRRQTDLTRAHLQQCARSLSTYLTRFGKSLNSSHAKLVEECQRSAQGLVEMFQQHLPSNSTAVQHSPTAEPSLEEGNTQLES